MATKLLSEDSLKTVLRIERNGKVKIKTIYKVALLSPLHSDAMEEGTSKRKRNGAPRLRPLRNGKGAQPYEKNNRRKAGKLDLDKFYHLKYSQTK